MIADGCNYKFQTKEDRLTVTAPEIILTDKAAQLLEVDAIAYPEDTHLIVDPYADLEEPAVSMNGLIAEAESTLPRPLGEITTVRAKGTNAAWLLRLVLLDLDRQHLCRAKMVEQTLSKLVWQVADMKIQRLGLDRFELLESCISAYRVLSCLCNQIKNVAAVGSSTPTTLIFSIQQPGALRHYQVALANLPK